MAATEEDTAERVLQFAGKPAVALENEPGALAAALKCEICSSLMLEPYIVECGHSFCGACLLQWIDVGSVSRGHAPTCPVCRESIRSAPRFNFALRGLVECITRAWNAAHADDELSLEMTRSEHAKRFKAWERKFNPIYSAEDNMYLCAECLHEIDPSGQCSFCDMFYPDMERFRPSEDEDYVEEGEDDDDDDDDDEMHTSDREFVTDSEDDPAFEAARSHGARARGRQVRLESHEFSESPPSDGPGAGDYYGQQDVFRDGLSYTDWHRRELGISYFGNIEEEVRGMQRVVERSLRRQQAGSRRAAGRGRSARGVIDDESSSSEDEEEIDLVAEDQAEPGEDSVICLFSSDDDNEDANNRNE